MYAYLELKIVYGRQLHSPVYMRSLRTKPPVVILGNETTRKQESKHTTFDYDTYLERMYTIWGRVFL